MWESENKQFIGFRHGFVPVLAKQDLWCGELEWVETLDFWKAWERGKWPNYLYFKKGPQTQSVILLLIFSSSKLCHTLVRHWVYFMYCYLSSKKHFLLILFKVVKLPCLPEDQKTGKESSTMPLVSPSDNGKWLDWILKSPSVSDLKQGNEVSL